jgi:DNA mismatch repair ATPase MutS
MAGKSTFLRTIGTNIILALNGMPVFADSFIIKPTHLFTSMRATDSINKSSSYFLSEVKRLKLLINGLNEQKKYFVILDEILMGTNSDDKLLGSTLFTEKVIRYQQATGLLATHDIPLTKLQEKYPKTISNYKFEADILSDENIVYDYKLKEGVVSRMNAMHLMKTLDIV